MRIFQEPADINSLLRKERTLGKKVGFVATMGALHEGHLALIAASKRENDITVCSIFVNPTQFNNKEDLQKYPRPFDLDRQKLEEAGCDVLFAPSESQMYPEPPRLKMDFGNLETVMEGKFRPGHFNGVGIVVGKLFNIIQPDTAYFGQKDYQQFLVISTLLKDLSFPIRLVCNPTVRESSGLALSSRNLRLNEREKALAPIIFKCLQNASEGILSGHSIESVKSKVSSSLEQNSDFKLEYTEVADSETLEILNGNISSRKVVICIAAFLGGVRLIDNVLVEVK